MKLLVAKPTYLFTSAKSTCFNGTCFIAAMFWCWVSTNLIKLGKSLWEPPIIVISFRYGLVTVSINWFYSYLLGFRWFYSPTVDPARLTAPLRGWPFYCYDCRKLSSPIVIPSSPAAPLIFLLLGMISSYEAAILLIFCCCWFAFLLFPRYRSWLFEFGSSLIIVGGKRSSSSWEPIDSTLVLIIFVYNYCKSRMINITSSKTINALF